MTSIWLSFYILTRWRFYFRHFLLSVSHTWGPFICVLVNHPPWHSFVLPSLFKRSQYTEPILNVYDAMGNSLFHYVMLCYIITSSTDSGLVNVCEATQTSTELGNLSKQSKAVQPSLFCIWSRVGLAWKQTNHRGVTCLPLPCSTCCHGGEAAPITLSRWSPDET